MDKKQKLIDADEFIRTIHYHDEQQKTDVWLTEEIEYLLAEQPVVNAKPVVHGRWEKDPDMRRMNGHIYDYRCSHCHTPAEKGIYNNNDRFTNYCPNCGADMR